MDFRGILAWAPAEMETHLYLEVLGAALSGLSFRGNFLPGVLFPVNKGELPLATPALETEVGATATALYVGEELELACFWLFTQVNFDFFKKDASTWPWLAGDAGSMEGFDTLGRAARGGTVLASGTAGVVFVSVGLVSVLVTHVLVGLIRA